MPRTNPKRALLVAGWLAGAAWPCAAAASPPAPLVSLVAPRAGQTLVAGETATLEWTPGASLAADRRAEEWEAFLSVDGGAHYTVRVTPHLDRDLRRISFRVPDLPTVDARLLLRFGDERREVACELPQRFAIARSAGGLALFEPAALAARAGEPARPGEPGVRRWVEGSRRGGATREVESSAPPAAEGIADPAADRRTIDALAPEPAPESLPARSVATTAFASPPGQTARRGPSLAAPPAADILLLTRRRNE